MPSPAPPEPAVPSYLVRGLIAGFAAVLLLLAIAGIPAVRDTRDLKESTAALAARQLRITRLLHEAQLNERITTEALHRILHRPQSAERAALATRLDTLESRLAALAADGAETPQAPLWAALRDEGGAFASRMREALSSDAPMDEATLSAVFAAHDRIVAVTQDLLKGSAAHLADAEQAIERQSLRLAGDSTILLGICFTLAAACAVGTIGFVRHGVRRMTAQADQLNRVTWHMLQGQEEVARRFSHELHDELGQSLAAVRAGLTRSATPDLESLRADCLHLVDESIANVRELSQLLRPVILDDFGLDAGLRWLTEKFAQRAHIELRYESDVTGRYADATETHLYRIAQEALTNVSRHSGATAVRVALEEIDGFLHLTIEDNGRGLVPREQRSDAGIGMVSMRERARQSGGELRIDRSAAGGVRLRVRVPARNSGAPGVPEPEDREVT